MSKFKEYEKRYGKHPGDNVVSYDTKNDVNSNLVATSIAFVFQLFFTGPNKNWRNPLSVIVIGLFFLSVNAFFLFNQSMFNSLLDFFNFGEGIQVLMRGVFCIYLIIQCIRGIWIIGGWNQNPIGRPLNVVPGAGGIRRGGSRAYYKTNTNHLEDAMGATTSWMNSKMQSMTPNQRESYLRDFHGGKK
tara:strand:- start:1009 stop:1572 length:564 start_codon:yes stop_codon:yes gene_type:complete